ncbi:MAG: hypothetical protein ABI596_09350 [Pyrinomonadaceae bacterium]
MTRTVLAALLLSLSAAACEQTPTETNSNGNSAPKAATAQASPTPVPVQPPEPIASAKPQLKAGDKVKVATNGSTSEATVISVDEKGGQVTVKLHGESKEKTVAIGDIIR